MNDYPVGKLCPGCASKNFYHLSDDGVVDWYKARCDRCGKVFEVVWNMEDAVITEFNELETDIARRPSKKFKSRVYKLSLEKEMEIYQSYQSGLFTQKQLARTYNVTQTTIFKALQRMKEYDRQKSTCG